MNHNQTKEKAIRTIQQQARFFMSKQLVEEKKQKRQKIQENNASDALLLSEIELKL